jgi:pimeloyl-ACP methyl ester carboxylesterase
MLCLLNNPCNVPNQTKLEQRIHPHAQPAQLPRAPVGRGAARRAAAGAGARLDGRGRVLPVHGGCAAPTLPSAPDHRARLARLRPDCTCPACDHYVFADYLADLDALLDHYAPDQPVDLLGHSMGGNVVMQYAGARPDTHPAPGQPGRLWHAGQPAGAGTAPAGQWLDELKPAPGRDQPEDLPRRRRRGPAPDEDQPAPAGRQGRLAGAPVGATRGRRHSGGSWATRRTRSSTPACSGSTRCWRCTPPSRRRCW